MEQATASTIRDAIGAKSDSISAARISLGSSASALRICSYFLTSMRPTRLTQGRDGTRDCSMRSKLLGVSATKMNEVESSAGKFHYNCFDPQAAPTVRCALEISFGMRRIFASENCARE